MNWRIAAVPLMAWMLAGCADKLPRADVGVDVYLHPEAAGADDILLQTAIRRKIADVLPGRAGLVHVSSVDRVVFLSGSVASDEDKTSAVNAARNIDLRVDGKAITPAQEIHFDRLTVAKLP